MQSAASPNQSTGQGRILLDPNQILIFHFQLRIRLHCSFEATVTTNDGHFSRMPWINTALGILERRWIPSSSWLILTMKRRKKREEKEKAKPYHPKDHPYHYKQTGTHTQLLKDNCHESRNAELCFISKLLAWMNRRRGGQCQPSLVNPIGNFIARLINRILHVWK